MLFRYDLYKSPVRRMTDKMLGFGSRRLIEGMICNGWWIQAATLTLISLRAWWVALLGPWFLAHQ